MNSVTLNEISGRSKRQQMTYDVWIMNLQIWIDEIKKYKLTSEIVEACARVLVNKGRIFKYLVLIVIGMVFVGLTAAVFDKEARINSLLENDASLMLSDIKESAASKAKKQLIPYLQEDEQKQRRKAITNVCKNAMKSGHDEINAYQHSKIQPEMFNQLYVDDKHKVIYCEVPKVACTNFKRIMLIMSGKVNTTDPLQLASSLVHGEYMKYLRKLSTYTPKQISVRLSQYFKFMFVREPLERTLSAYRNKFTKHYNDYFKVRFGKMIIKRYRKKPNKASLETGKDVKFGEFVKYLTDPVTHEQGELNAHWKQFYKLCHPCQVKYDFIGKYDNLDEDVDKVLDILNLSDKVHFPKGRNGVSTADLTKQYFSNISSQDIHKLWKLYSVDYSMFGYKYPNVR